MTFAAVDIGPFVGLGNHDDGVLDTPTSIQFDRTGRVVRKVPSALGESALRQQLAALTST